jgi:DNA-binding NarL/FixJ family response regulator
MKMFVLLADSSNESACGCGSLLRELDCDATIYRALSLNEALTQLKIHPRLDLIVWHACVQTDEAFELARSMADMAMGVPIVILSKVKSPAQLGRAMQSGVNGYICLPARRALILEILRLVLSGGAYFPASILIDRIQEDAAPGSRRIVPEDAPRSLTPRQKDVLGLLVDGRTNREIAGSLGISEATAKLHVSALLRAMDVRTRDEAVRRARPVGFALD